MRQPLTLARILLAFLAIVNVYRAATQSLTTDEAFTYNRSVATPIPDLWQNYDANDHVLHTLLCKASVNLFGLSELTLRLPSLLGGFLFLWIALRLSRDAFGDGWRMLVCLVLLVLNPMLLDYGSIARGYGMAMSLFLTAMLLLLEESRCPSRWRLLTASILLALAVAANLTVLVPTIALVIAYSWIALVPAIRARRWATVRFRVNRIIDRVLVPFIVVAVAILLVPLMPADRKNFYVGAADVPQSFLSFGEALFYRPDPAYYQTMLHDQLKPAMARAMGYGVFPLLLLVGCGIALTRFWRQPEEPDVPTMTGVVLAGCCAAFLILHVWQGVPYPYRRTGLYLLPLLTLTGVHVLSRWRLAGLALAAVTLASFLLSFNVHYYDEWIFDAGTKELMQRLRELRPADGSRRILATSAYLDQTARFYAKLYGMDWIQIAHSDSGDLYLLTLNEHTLIQKRGLRKLYEDPVSMVALAQSTTAPQPRRDKSQ